VRPLNLWPASQFGVSLPFKPRVSKELIKLMYKPLSKARDGLRMNGSSTIAVAKKRKRDLMEESDSESSSTQNESTSEGDSEMNSEDGSGLSEEDDDAEQFRASQWVDEDDLDVYENRNTGAWNSGQVSFGFLSSFGRFFIYFWQKKDLQKGMSDEL
jgi:hypothetical protein